MKQTSEDSFWKEEVKKDLGFWQITWQWVPWGFFPWLLYIPTSCWRSSKWDSKKGAEPTPKTKHSRSKDTFRYFLYTKVLMEGSPDEQKLFDNTRVSARRGETLCKVSDQHFHWDSKEYCIPDIRKEWRRDNLNWGNNVRKSVTAPLNHWKAKLIL